MFNWKACNPIPDAACWWKPALAVAGALALGACATVPQPLTGTYSEVSPNQAAKGGVGGTQVRWGGQIIKTEPEAHQTCFFVLSRPLDSSARPETNDAGHGRFMACHDGFYDPEVFTKGREVTFTGTVHGIVSRMVGKYDYAYPRLEANAVYLWPKRPRVVRYNNPYGGFNPFWGPIGPFYDPFWYQPRVIVVRPPAHHAPPPKKSH
jgi:outer membrane lipoprotein